MLEFVKLWVDARPYLLSWLIAERIVRQPADAFDVYQEGYFAAARSWSEDVRRPLDLFKHILRNVAVDFYRARKERQLQQVALEWAEHVSRMEVAMPEDAVAHREETQRVHNALDGLRRDQRLALLMRYRDGLSFKAIGAAMDRSAASARMLVLRSKASLRKSFRGEGVSP